MGNNIKPVILTALELNVSFGEQVILKDASLSIHLGDRIGLVGRNGAGKSTFLKIISGNFQPDSGEIAKKKDLEISFLTQEFTLDESKTVYENIRSGADKINKLLEQYENASFDSPEHEQLELKINELDGWNLDKRIGGIIEALNAPAGDRKTYSLSGGEKRRTALCRALISEPDLLMLDEPTNHLDTESIEWIENFLASYDGTCIFVTHDRYFLDRIADKIVELSEGKFHTHHGGYSDYLVDKAEREAIREAEEKKRQSFLKREIEWIARGPKARRSKAKSRIDKYYEIASRELFSREMDVELIIPKAERLGKNIVELKNAGVSMGGKTLFQNLNFKFDKGRRLGIIGKNGAGKTTLLKLILGETAPDEGSIIVGENTIFNYIDQERIVLNDDDTVIDSIGEGNDFILLGGRQIKVWTYLKRFLFTDDRINVKVGRLSGGERSRLTLAKILKRGGNFLMLDEPTNDLDLPTLRILEEALIQFDGCVIVVSHDRYFLNRVCNGIFAFEDDGRIYISEGNYDYYIEKKKRRLTPAKNVSGRKSEPKRAGKSRAKKKKLSWKEERELESIEEKILSAEEEAERIQAIFSSPDFYEKHAAESNLLNEQLNAAKKTADDLYSRWEELEKLKSELSDD